MKYLRIVLLSLILSLLFSKEAYCKNKVVVIDPGHGGEALGGNMDDRIERDINLITAEAFMERLSMYEGVDVYITRTNNTDADIDRKTRFKTAVAHDADLFCSVHYNMSEYHTLYGTEVWVPMTGREYAAGMEFATILNKDLSDLGLFNRGIKHRDTSDGKSEYYGILKYGVENSIPSVIIEHCHLDNPNDSAFWNFDAYREFGYTDADAVAKYLRLSSSVLNVNYSEYDRQIFDIPASAVLPDKTEPEACNIELIDFDASNNTAQISVCANDSDGYIQYYALSFDDGNTYCELTPWADSASHEIVLEVPVTPGEHQLLRCIAYNQYDLYKESNSVELPFIEPEPATSDTNSIITDDIIYIEQQSEHNNNKLVIYMSVILAILLLIFIVLITVLIINRNKRKKRKRKHRKNNASR